MNDSLPAPPVARDLSWLVRRYMRALVIVTVVLSLGQAYTQHQLSLQEGLLDRIDAVQGQLSASYQLHGAGKDLAGFQARQASLVASLDHDPTAVKLLRQAEPPLQALLAGLRSRGGSLPLGGRLGDQEREAREQLRFYLELVVIHLHQVAQQRLNFLRLTELCLLGLVFLVMAVESMWVFRPAATLIKDMFLQDEANRQLLSRRLRQLHDSHENIKADLQAAADVQRSLLPRAMPEVPGWDFAWSFKACQHVGGDMFNIMRLDETHVGVYVLDVAGHGITAALLSVSLSRVISANLGSLLKRRIPEPPYYQLARPSEVATELNRLFPVMSETDQFFTMVYGVLDCQNHTFTFVQAGHPGPVCLQGDLVRVWDVPPDLPIGILPDVQYTDITVQLEPGALLFLYTDGALDAHSPSDELFGLERMTSALQRHRGLGLEGCLESLYEEMRRFTGGRSQKDDLTLLGFALGAEASGHSYEGGGPGSASVRPSKASEVTKSGRYRSWYKRTVDQLGPPTESMPPRKAP